MSAALPVNPAASERPIIFTAESVRAILDTRKTQTRRVVRGPEKYERLRDCAFACPYGVPGDRLWVRETWGYRWSCWSSNAPDTTDRAIEYADGALRKIGRPSNDESGLPKMACRCEAGGGYGPDGLLTEQHREELVRFWKSWRSPIHMPRWASRLTLEVTEVKVQRLQEISEKDARAEGAERVFDGTVGDLWRFNYGPAGRGDNAMGKTARGGFQFAWDSINCKRAPWSSDPWVWAISFRMVA
jgi:hypothetical protein